MSKLIPLHNNVLLRRAKSEDKTPGGLIIPTTAAEKSQEGEVLAVGRGMVANNGNIVSPTVKCGDVVMFEKHRGIDVKLNGEDFLLITEDHIIGIIEK